MAIDFRTRLLTCLQYEFLSHYRKSCASCLSILFTISIRTDKLNRMPAYPHIIRKHIWEMRCQFAFYMARYRCKTLHRIREVTLPGRSTLLLVHPSITAYACVSAAMLTRANGMFLKHVTLGKSIIGTQQVLEIMKQPCVIYAAYMQTHSFLKSINISWYFRKPVPDCPHIPRRNLSGLSPGLMT